MECGNGGRSFRPPSVLLVVVVKSVSIVIEVTINFIVITTIINAILFSGCLANSRPPSTSRTLEYCDTEVLRAECADDHVIMMERANYGRMKLGRCVEMEMGHIGCFTDVIKMADRRCSGRRVCELRVPDAEFESTEPCLKELKSYLEASYKCVKLENRGKDCNVDGENQGSVGHISNEVSGEGGMPCPVADQSWVISGKPGQHVRLILYDFSIPDDNSSYGEGSSFRQKKEDRKCRQFGTVYDTEKEETQMICGSHAERMSHVYTSTGHNVKLYLQASHPSQRYLVRFSVEGCPWPNLPEGAWMQNKNLSSIVIGCNFSNSGWHLFCTGSSWEGLNEVDCPKFATTSTSSSSTSSSSSSSPSPPSPPFSRSDELGHLLTPNLSPSKLGSRQKEIEGRFRTFQHQGSEFHDDDDRFVEFAGLLGTTITAIVAIVVLLILIVKVSRETSQKQDGDGTVKRTSILLKENLQKDNNCRKKEPSPNFDLNENQRLLTNLRAELEMASAV